jgi:hypothetical protein
VGSRRGSNALWTPNRCTPSEPCSAANPSRGTCGGTERGREEGREVGRDGGVWNQIGDRNMDNEYVKHRYASMLLNT